MLAWSRALAGNRRFQDFIIGVIVFNAVIMGLETSTALMASYGLLFRWLNIVVQVQFVAEIAVRILACAPRPLRFFRDGWNVFDFTIVALSLIPAVGAFSTVARLARLLRVTRLISAFPDLRLIISTMLRSIPSMGHVILLLSLLLYVYGILGYHLFHVTDPLHWGTLGRSLLTLFQILTLEGWVEIQQAGMKAHPWVWVYYASFVVVAVFVVINLFIAVVINNLEAAKAEQAADADTHLPQHDALRRIAEIRASLEQLEHTIRRSATGIEASPEKAIPS